MVKVTGWCGRGDGVLWFVEVSGCHSETLQYIGVIKQSKSMLHESQPPEYCVHWVPPSVKKKKKSCIF
jgi:hypothetical protein